MYIFTQPQSLQPIFLKMLIKCIKSDILYIPSYTFCAFRPSLMKSQLGTDKLDKQTDSIQVDTGQQEISPIQRQPVTFKFTPEEIQKINILLPKCYSFIRKDVLENIKAGVMPKGPRGKPEMIKFIQRKFIPSHQEAKQPEQQVVYPDFSNAQFFKNQEPQIFAEVVTGDFRPRAQHSTKQKQQPKPPVKKKPLTRDDEIAQMTITKVFTPGVRLPNPSRYKQSLKREMQREKKQKEKQQRQILKDQMKVIKKDHKKGKNTKDITIVAKSQKQAVDRLFDEFQKNEKSTVIFQARTKPSMQFYWKMISAKKSKMYPLAKFQADLRRMFKIYYNTSGSIASKMKQVKKYQQQLFDNIRTIKKKLGISVTIQEEISKEKHELSQTVITETESLNVSSRGRKRNNLVLNFQTKKEWKKRSKISRQVVRQYSTLNRQILGKNICRMPKQQIEDFCLEFCLFFEQKTRENSATFDFNLMRFEAETLFQMQNYVRNILARHSLPYLQLSDDQVSSQFVIQDDD